MFDFPFLVIVCYFLLFACHVFVLILSFLCYLFVIWVCQSLSFYFCPCHMSYVCHFLSVAVGFDFLFLALFDFVLVLSIFSGSECIYVSVPQCIQ